METKSQAHSPVTFHVFRKDGSKNPEIKMFFLDNMILDAHAAAEGKLTLQDKTEWELVLEAPVKEAFRSQHSVRCLVSFQARIQGNFAVARLYDATKTNTKRRS